MALTAPTGITVTASSSGNVLTWTAGTSAVYTKIYRADDWNGVYTLLADPIAAATVTYTDAGGVQTHCYKFSSTGSDGIESALTEYYSVSTLSQALPFTKFTSKNRFKQLFYGADAGTVTVEDYDIVRLITSVSQKIERFLKRKVLNYKRAEFFSIIPGQYHFYPEAYPINYVYTLHYDPTGAFTGDEVEVDITDPTVFTVSNDGRYFILNYNSTTAPNGLRLIYNGGLADHCVRTQVKGTIAATAWTVGRYVTGGTSGAVGKLYSTDAAGSSKYQVIETLYGSYEVGETLTESTTIGGSATAGVSTVIDKITALSLAEGYGADIVTLCEKQIIFELKHRQDSWIGSLSKDQANIDMVYKHALLPEVMEGLKPFVNHA